MKTSTKLLSMFSVFCASLLLGLTANAQSITVSGGLTANQMAQVLVGSNVTVTNATFTGAATSSGSFNQATSTFPLSDGIILTSGSVNNALGPNNSTGMSTSNGTPGDADLGALVPGFPTFDASVLEFDITSNCNTLTFDYIFASEEYPEYACSNFNDAFGFFISGPGFAPNTNIALVPGTTTPVSINNVINSPATNCVSNPAYYVDNANGLSIQYDGHTVTLTATATIQPCQTYHIKIAVADAGDSALDSAVFLKGGGINCSSSNLVASANISGVECGALGAIDLVLGSGTGPFTYAWTGPNSFTATAEDLTGLAAGDYTVDIVGSDCLSSGQFTFIVNNNADVTAPLIANCPTDISVVTPTNSCDATANWSAPSVTDNCPNVSVTASHNSGDVFPIGTTTVTYTATDASGNSSVCSFDVIVSAHPLIALLTPHVYNGGVNIRCYGQNSGRVTCGVTGGCAPYTYAWSAGIPVLGGTLSVGLYAGSVSVTVTDANGSSVTGTVNLTQNPPLQSIATWSPILCYGGSSIVTVNAAGGTFPYSGLTTYTVFPGTYMYTVADANGCRNKDTITVTQPDILDVTATPTAILCYGDSADVTVAATGGTLPYTGTGVVSEVAGVYTYVVTDANGCTENTTLGINQPAQLTAGISATPILCNGGTSQVTVSVVSGTEPYAGTGVFTEVAGTYTYIVYDYNLCSDTISITITEPTLLVATATSTVITCNGGTSTITVSGAGGTPIYMGEGTYTVTAGTYTYTVTDANGCTADVTITIMEPTPVVASATSTPIITNGGMSDITVVATGGTAPYSGIGTFSVLPGTYSYVVTDANGCTETVTITVIELIIDCAVAATISADMGDCSATNVTLGSPTIIGNNVAVSITNDAPLSFPIGTTIVTWTVIDVIGNITTCTQVVTVEDNEGPTIACPADYTIDCNNPFIPIDSVIVTATDCSNIISTTIVDSVSCTGLNCTGIQYIYRTITATDEFGNVSTCTQIITGGELLTEGECKKCDSEISVIVDVFNPSCVWVISCKNLSNVVLSDINGWEYKFDGLNGYTAYFCHPSGLPITDVWVKAGCFKSGDGPGYGHHFGICGNGTTALQSTITEHGKNASIKEDAELGQYPNPADHSSTFKFTVPETGDVNLVIVNLQGEVIASLVNEVAEAKRDYTVTYDVSELQGGIYFAILNTSNGTVKKKFIVLR
ncbi:MAG: HYR domain-containing protein [Crocinitomicaceae bacterium]|nr:choice-of-anchor L domain-containing protein [Flavobacteriales bacterium]NQZ36747.1 HYR domain-containing protein [Crocinitomicaceae bacterium]